MKILLTGATGYIGRRLLPVLLAEGHSVVCCVRDKNRFDISQYNSDRVEVVEVNFLEKETLKAIPADIEAAYYLIHSMGAKKDFQKLDRISAENFRDACIAGGVRRVIYLGGLGSKDTASKHLLSRLETGEILSASPDKIQTFWFRAGIIIGSGSASFEIIRDLVEKLPVMITPKWVHTKTQPIGVRDVIEYLARAKDLTAEKNLVIDIGSERMSFKEMLEKAGQAMGLKRWLIPVPKLTPHLSSYWLVLMTPVPFAIARELVEGLKSETVVQNDHAQTYFPEIVPASFQETVRGAIEDIEDSQVLSSWCDTSSGASCELKGREDIADAIFSEEYSVSTEGVPPGKIFSLIKTLGGKSGWPNTGMAWKLRGLADKILGGPGLSRGRRDPYDLRVGDSLDFWKVVDIIDGRRLLLLNQMKVPGKAWLEYTLQDHTLTQKILYRPRGLWGRLYWLLSKPIHAIIFPLLIAGIVKKARKAAANG